MSDQPRPTKGERVADQFYEHYINQRVWIKGETITQGEFISKLSEVINAALDAERDEWIVANRELALSNLQLREQLAAEREKVRTLVDTTTKLTSLLQNEYWAQTPLDVAEATNEVLVELEKVNDRK